MTTQELSQDLPLDAWCFGGDSDLLAELVLQGKKTAVLPKAGSYSVLLNSRKEPQAVIFLKETFVKKFSEIDEHHAWEEGEGNRSLEHWREVHAKFFSAYEAFHEESELLCERFEVISCAGEALR